MKCNKSPRLGNEWTMVIVGRTPSVIHPSLDSEPSTYYPKLIDRYLDVAQLALSVIRPS